MDDSPGVRTVMLGVHPDVGVHPGIWWCTPGSGSGRVLTGTVLFYPCSHVIHNSVFTGTGPELIPWIPGIHPGIHPR